MSSVRRAERGKANSVRPKLEDRHIGCFRTIGKPEWRDTEVVLPKNSSVRWQSIITGHELMIQQDGARDSSGGTLGVPDLFAHFPVALFCSVG